MTPFEAASIATFIKRSKMSENPYGIMPLRPPELIANEIGASQWDVLQFSENLTFTSNCTQCQDDPGCCYTSHSPGSIFNGECVTKEVMSALIFH